MLGARPELRAAAEESGDVREWDLPCQESLDGELVRGRQADHRAKIAGARGLEDHGEARVALDLDLAEVERAVSGPVEARSRRRRAVPKERVLDRQPHIRFRELRLHAAVDVLHE